MDIFELLKDFTEKMIKNTNHEGWIQAGKLTPEDQLKLRNIRARTKAAEREFEILMNKLKALKATQNAESGEWWAYLYKTYGLPDGEYSIEDDGRILTAPKSKTDEN